MDFDHTESSEDRERAVEKLSFGLPGDAEAERDGGAGVREEDSGEEENSSPDGVEATPSENARGEEEHSSPEARTDEDPPKPSLPPSEDRIFAGRYKTPDALEQAYQHLEAEFHRRSKAQADLEQRLGEAEQTRRAMELQMLLAVEKPKLSAEKLEELRQKADAWGCSEEMLIEQELERLTAGLQAHRAAQFEELRTVGSQAAVYLQQHPQAAQDGAAVARMVEEHQGLFETLPWQNPAKVAQTVRGYIDLMYAAAERDRLRAEVAEVPKKLEAARLQLREELASQASRKAAASTVAATAQARAPRVGAEGGAASGESVKREILEMAPRNRWWMNDE